MTPRQPVLLSSVYDISQIIQLGIWLMSLGKIYDDNSTNDI